MGVWANLLPDKAFIKQISTQGYSKEVQFKDYVDQYNLGKEIRRYGAITAGFLSIDFFSGQDKDLTSKGLFLLRTGQGKFIVLSNSFFDSPYLQLNPSQNAEEILFEVPKTCEILIEAYKDRLNETATVELMHTLGVFEKILYRVLGEREYFIGPRGNRTSKFDVYFNRSTAISPVKLFTYCGQEELDYSIFTSKAILVIEAKNTINGLDLGWHKITYPLKRFERFNCPKIPCYFLKQGKIVWIFIFPEYNYYNQGIILNDKRAMTPSHTFKVDLSVL